MAIIGATGCGKSTVINLIPRFYDVTEGEVLVDGVNVKDYKQKELRNKSDMFRRKLHYSEERLKVTLHTVIMEKTALWNLILWILYMSHRHPNLLKNG